MGEEEGQDRAQTRRLPGVYRGQFKKGEAVPTTPQTKRCPSCGETKPSGEFHRNHTAYDGLQSWCKVCRSRYNATPAGKAAQAAAYHRWLTTERGRTLKRISNVIADQRRSTRKLIEQYEQDYQQEAP